MIYPSRKFGAVVKAAMILQNYSSSNLLHHRRRRLTSSAKRKRTAPTSCRNRKNALLKMYSLPDWQFKRTFRVDRRTFDCIVEEIRPYLQRNVEMASRNVKNKLGEVVSVEIMLMATLRYLAGGMIWDIVNCLDIAPGSF